MNLLKDMWKDVYKKIDKSNTDFCSTPLGPTQKLTSRMARTILLGKGNIDDLLANAGNDEEGDRCHERVCTHKHH